MAGSKNYRLTSDSGGNSLRHCSARQTSAASPDLASKTN